MTRLKRIVETGVSFLRENRSFVMGASFMTLANLGDTITTIYAFDLVGREGSPVMNHFIETYGITNAGLMKIGAELGSLFLLYKFKHRQLMTHAVGTGLTGFMYYNLYNLKYYW